MWCRLGGILLAALIPAAAAADSLSEPQLMIYYQIPFDHQDPAEVPSFGLRLDRVQSDPRARPEFRELMRRTGMLDLRLTARGVDYLSIGASRYVRAIQTARADEEEGAEAGEGEQEDKQGEEEKSKSIGQYLDEVPAGYLIGAAIGIALIAGVGD